MKAYRGHRFAQRTLSVALLSPLLALGASVGNIPAVLQWRTVANNGDFMPSSSCAPAPADLSCRTFNSFNQPSVNKQGLVVFRARSKGGQGMSGPLQGVYTHDMSLLGTPIVRVIDRDIPVPQPNNRDVTFQETAAFPRIDADSSTIVTRGTHQPVWQQLDSAGETVAQVGTNGVYANPYGFLVTAESRLGSLPGFSYFQVPESPGTAFDIVAGAPAVTAGNIVVFKGNYTSGLVTKTGVYYRYLTNGPFQMVAKPSSFDAIGNRPVVLIANTDDYIPGTLTPFGSTAPPSAAGRNAVFVGLDNEDNPTMGGIYLASLDGFRSLRTLVRIGDTVPGELPTERFKTLGEGLSFDGRFVAFWASWGDATQSLLLQCPQDGNTDLVAFCNTQYPNGHVVQVPVHQGVFVKDIASGRTWAVAKSPTSFNDFLYWNFSGHVPGSTTEGDDGEPARWRSAAFVASSGLVDGSLADPQSHVAFKARTGALTEGTYVNPVDGIYLVSGPPSPFRPASPFRAVVTTGMNGTLLDPEALDPETGQPLPITTVGVEREGLRGNQLVINASMASESTGWAGIYLAKVRW